MLKKPRVALYARISTDDDRQNLETQLRELRAYAKRQKWTLHKDEYTDRASGGKDRRPGLDALMAGAARKEFDYVLVFDLSRLTRTGPASAFKAIERLKASGVELWSFREEHFRTAGPLGELLIAIGAFVAQQEREAIRARVRAGMDRAREEGKAIGRPETDIDEATLLQLRAQGLSIRAIAEQLRTTRGVIERRLNIIQQEEERRRQLARRIG